MTRIISLVLLACGTAYILQAQTSIPGVTGQSGAGSSSVCAGGSIGNCVSGSDSTGQQQDQYSNPMSVGIPTSPAAIARQYSRTLGSNPAVTQENGNLSSTRAVPPITTKSDFQIFAEDAAGQTLQVYGRDLFNQGPSTFPVLDHVPVPAGYVIGPDDEMHVEIWGKIDADITVTVDRNGQIYIPRIGSLGVAGLRYDQLESYVRNAVAKNFKDFDLNVTLGKLRSIQIYVLGSARQPGAYTVSALSTLIDALFVSGGPSASGSMRSIELRRAGKIEVTIDLYDVLRRADKSNDIKLLPDDVIYIAPVGPQVAIVGNVHDPAIYELKKDLSVAEALENAGGLTVMASTERALIERIENHRLRQVEEIGLENVGMHRKLRDGDVLRIEPVSPQFAGTVMLRGSVAAPGRYKWRDGMRVSDLIPSREALITRDHWIQQNHIIEYQQNRIAEKHQIQLEQAQLADEDAMNNAQLSVGQRSELGKQSSALQSTILSSGIQSYQPVDSAALNVNGQQDQQSPNGQNGVSAQPSLSGQPTSTWSGDQSSQSPYKPLDILGDLNLTDAQINWDYAVIQRLDKKDLSTRLISFNLGEAIANPTSDANQVLLSGDMITIFNHKDLSMPTEKHSAFVQIQGEVGSPGVYPIHPGESLRDIIKRAGGLTQYSYLFAMQLNRESTRKQQQEQLVNSIQRLRKDLAAAYANSGSPAMTPSSTASNAGMASAAEAIGEKQMLSEQQNLIDRLLTVQTTGRIALGIRPAAGTIDDLPEFHLENGDTITVPPRMDTVQVIGEVYNENALRYRAGRRVSDYLGDTGGPTRVADNARTYVIRADGTVIGRHMGKSRWAGKFDNIVLMPGDAVIVPPKIKIPGGAMENLIEITGVLAQSAITGAVLHSVL